MIRSTRSVFAATLSTLLLAPVAYAGPPMLCHPLDTGGAPSLPWRDSHGWKGTKADYDRTRLVPDTLALLGPDVAVIARMETLRRASLYAHDGGSGSALLKALEERAGNAGNAERALALFDLGYGHATLIQAGALGGSRYQTPPAAYGKVQEAIRLRGGDPAMEYAAALMNHDGAHQAVAFEHLSRAVSGAKEGTPLARTLTAHREMWGSALDRARAGVAQK